MKKIIVFMLLVCSILVGCVQNDEQEVESSKIESSDDESITTDTYSREESSAIESAEESSEISNEEDSSEPAIESSEEDITSQPDESSEVSQAPEVSETPTEPTLAAWQQAYLNYIEADADFSPPFSYSLIYIDNDEIPEMYIWNDYYDYQPGTIISYKNGKIISVSAGQSASYVEKSGKLCTNYGNMGYFYTNVYQLTDNGFAQVLTATEEIVFPENPDEEYQTLYAINDTPATEEEFNAALDAVYDSASSKNCKINKVSGIDAKNQILALSK